MAELSNPRHERFAQLLVEGNAADTAYAEAGYKPNRGNAIRLKTNENVCERVNELQKRAGRRHEVTVDSVIAGLVELRDQAQAKGQLSAAVRAQELIGKTCAAFVDVSRDDSSKMTNEALAAVLGAHLGEDATATLMQKLRDSDPSVKTVH